MERSGLKEKFCKSYRQLCSVAEISDFLLARWCGAWMTYGSVVAALWAHADFQNSPKCRPTDQGSLKKIIIYFRFRAWW